MPTTIVNCFYDDNVWKMNKIECNFLENAKNDFTKEWKGCDKYKTILQTFYLGRFVFIYIIARLF